MNKNFLDLLQSLNSHKVRYLIIGGYAFSLHVEPRFTKDLDLWVDASLENGRRLLQALGEFGAPIDNLCPEDIAKPGLLYIFGIPPQRVDILNRIKRQQFSKAYQRKTVIKLGPLKIPVVGLDDLVKQKKSAGRPQDLADLEKIRLYLKGVKDERGVKKQ